MSSGLALRLSTISFCPPTVADLSAVLCHTQSHKKHDKGTHMKNLNLMQRINRAMKKKIAGFTLAEVALATTIAMIGTSSALYVQQESLRSDIGRSQGEQLARFANALDIYMREYYTAISNNQPINYKVGTGTVRFQ